MAERLAVAYTHRAGIHDVSASSAGTRAMISHPVHPSAADTLEDFGADSSNFFAKQLNSKIAAMADLIITMTQAHREDVLQIAPQQIRRTFTISEAAHVVTAYNVRNISQLADYRGLRRQGCDAADIPDPFGKDMCVFQAVAESIAHKLPPILELCRPNK